MLMDNVLFSDNFFKNEDIFDRYFRTDLNYDVVGTRFKAGGRQIGRAHV